MTVTALIVAAGRGTRAGGSVAKQWQPLAGARVIDHTLRAFADHPQVDNIVLVLHAKDMDKAFAFQSTLGAVCVPGGAERAASVRAGLQAVPTGCTQVLIHDVARPCIDAQTISAVLRALDTSPGAAPALAVTDALWTGAEGRVTGTQDRTALYRAQTPQGFDFDSIKAAHDAYDSSLPAADDVAVARAAGLAVAIVPGHEDNLKITHPGDFARAERILTARQNPAPLEG